MSAWRSRSPRVIVAQLRSALRGGASAVVLAVTAALCLPAAASAQILLADLNGDGVYDRVDANPRSTEVHVSLSNRQHVQRLHLKEPIVRLVLVDVDRDGDQDLVASTARSNLRIWTNRGHGQFTSHVPPGPHSHWHTAPHSIEDTGSAPEQYGVWHDDARMLVAPVVRLPGDLAIAIRAPDTSDQPASRYRFRQRTPRGPPFPLLF